MQSFSTTSGRRKAVARSRNKNCIFKRGLVLPELEQTTIRPAATGVYGMFEVNEQNEHQ